MPLQRSDSSENSHNQTSSETDMERDLVNELNKLEQIFHDDDYILDDSSPNNRSRTSLRLGGTGEKRRQSTSSAFELAAAEAEREDMQDKLNMLLSRTEEHDSQLTTLNKNNASLLKKNEALMNENRLLQQELINWKATDRVNNYVASDLGKKLTEEQNNQLMSNYANLEYKLAETKSLLAQAQSQIDDLNMARDLTQQELDREKIKRVHAEKERDAYRYIFSSCIRAYVFLFYI